MRPVLVLPSDSRACGIYRLVLPAEACMAAGKPVLIQTIMPKIAVDKDNNVEGINIGNYQVVVVQRPGSYQIPQVIDIFHENGIRVIVDMDDSMSKIDPRNPVFKHYDPRINHKRNWMHVATSCEKADLVTCTTEALAEEYGSHGRVKIIKNHIPKRYLDIPRSENEIPIVTWAGWTVTHPDDLLVTGGMVNEALVETKARFMAFGDLNIFTDLKILHNPPNFHCNFENLNTYPTVLSQADIGIVPLKTSSFNDCKSWLKTLEYASLGIVPIASPTPDNLLFAELGGCIIARSPEDWKREISELVLDNDKRAEMSKKVREVASRFVIEENWEQWWKAWQGD